MLNNCFKFIVKILREVKDEKLKVICLFRRVDRVTANV